MDTTCKVCGGQHTTGACTEKGFEQDTLGSIPESQKYMEHYNGKSADYVKVVGDKSYPLGEGERLVMIGKGLDKKPFIRKDDIDTPFEDWKTKQK